MGCTYTATKPGPSNDRRKHLGTVQVCDPAVHGRASQTTALKLIGLQVSNAGFMHSPGPRTLFATVREPGACIFSLVSRWQNRRVKVLRVQRQAVNTELGFF